MLMFNEFFVYFFYHYVFNQNILFFAKVLCFLRRDTFKKKSEQRVTIVSCIIKVVFVYIFCTTGICLQLARNWKLKVTFITLHRIIHYTRSRVNFFTRFIPSNIKPSPGFENSALGTRHNRKTERKLKIDG